MLHNDAGRLQRSKIGGRFPPTPLSLLPGKGLCLRPSGRRDRFRLSGASPTCEATGAGALRPRVSARRSVLLVEAPSPLRSYSPSLVAAAEKLNPKGPHREGHGSGIDRPAAYSFACQTMPAQSLSCPRPSRAISLRRAYRQRLLQGRAKCSHRHCASNPTSQSLEARTVEWGDRKSSRPSGMRSGGGLKFDIWLKLDVLAMFTSRTLAQAVGVGRWS